MTFDRFLGFHASAGRRLIFAGIYAALAFAAAWAVERAPMMAANVADKPSAPVVDAALVTVRLETTYPVGAWTVQVGGKPMNTATTDARHWEGRVPVGASVFVQADHADATAATPAALRWTSGGASGIHWADGFVAATIQLPKAAR
jgi:hypothetical protein